MTVSQVNQWVAEWCEPVAAGDRVATDVEWPPGSGKWYRPSPLFQARVLGLWPDRGWGVWSDALREACQPDTSFLAAAQALAARWGDSALAAAVFPLAMLPQIGCDCATGKGEDYQAISCRWGTVSIYHETSNTMNAVRTFGRLKEVAAQMAALVNSLRPRGSNPVRPTEIPIKLDDDGVGGTLAGFLANEGYQVAAIGAGKKALDDEHYPRRRDELWFVTAERARSRRVVFLPTGILPGLGLDAASLRRLKQPLMAPKWKFDGGQRRKVESKDDTKVMIGRSPDDADSANLSFYEPPAAEYGVHGTPPRPERDQMQYQVHGGAGHEDWRHNRGVHLRDR